KMVSIFANRTTHQIKLAIRKDSIFITAEDPEIGGSAEEKIDATYDGDEMVIGYNAEYIKDILKHIDTGEVIFKLNTPVSAGLIYPTEQIEGEDLMMLLMPIRLSEEK
ncbi:MAG: DNA polymerase III subunit beta, partial [Fidelibacterota bacterium]